MVKKHSVSDAARTASLTDLRRWPGDGFFGKIPKSESRPRWKNPDLGVARARQAGGFDAGQLARARQAAGSDAGQVRRNCRIRRQFRFFFAGKNPDLGAGSDAGQARPVAR